MPGNKRMQAYKRGYYDNVYVYKFIPSNNIQPCSHFRLFPNCNASFLCNSAQRSIPFCEAIHTSPLKNTQKCGIFEYALQNGSLQK